MSVGHRFRTSVLVRRLSTTRRQSSGARTERPGRRPRCLAPALTQTFQAKLVQIVRVEPVGLWFVQPCNSTARTEARCDQSFSSAMMSCKTVIASGMLIENGNYHSSTGSNGNLKGLNSPAAHSPTQRSWPFSNVTACCDSNKPAQTTRMGARPRI